MDDAVAEMQARYPDDKFDIILRRVAPGQPFEWRVKCLDCPGKVRYFYFTGLLALTILW